MDLWEKKMNSIETVDNSNIQTTITTRSQPVQGKLVSLLAFTTIFNWLQTFYPWVEW